MRVLFIVSLMFLDLFGARSLEFYCGITMADAMRVIADKFEAKTGVHINITKGGSGSLYKKILKVKNVDLYMPGADKFIKDDKYGLFVYKRLMGYNRAVILVQKTNPKGITKLGDFLRKDVRVIIGDSNAGSVGKISKKILTRYKDENFFNAVYQKAIKAPTSVEIMQALKNNQADASINWKAAAFKGDNQKYVDFVDIPYIAPKQKLILTTIKYSLHPELARQFVKFAISAQNKKFFKSKGF